MYNVRTIDLPLFRMKYTERNRTTGRRWSRTSWDVQSPKKCKVQALKMPMPALRDCSKGPEEISGRRVCEWCMSENQAARLIVVVIRSTRDFRLATALEMFETGVGRRGGGGEAKGGLCFVRPLWRRCSSTYSTMTLVCLHCTIVTCKQTNVLVLYIRSMLDITIYLGSTKPVLP